MHEGKVVCYVSQKLNKHEQNYPMHGIELEVIIHALKLWRHYLLGRGLVMMSDQSVLRYLFYQLNLNGRHVWWLAMISQLDFEIKYIKGKDNRVVHYLSKKIKLIHLVAMSSYKRDLQDRIWKESQHDVRYMEIMYKLQQSTSILIGTCDSTGISRASHKGIGTNVGAHDVDYFIIVDKQVGFKDMIYVLDSSELKILRQFHEKPYLAHPGYQYTLIAVKKFYYWPNLKRYVEKFVARCFHFQRVKGV